jgi:hypothetical protein
LITAKTTTGRDKIIQPRRPAIRCANNCRNTTRPNSYRSSKRGNINALRYIAATATATATTVVSLPNATSATASNN